MSTVILPSSCLQGNAEGEGPRKKRRTNYSYIPEDVKMKVVDYAKIHGTRPAARLFNISEGTIRSWKMRGFNKPNPSIARGRKVTYGQDLDDELYLGLMAMINEQEIITVDQFTEYAKKIILERRPDLNFKCSRGWIDKFLNRHKLGVTKSEYAKVMHIVEQSEIPKPPKESSVYPKDAYLGTANSSMEIMSKGSPETSMMLTHSFSTPDSPPSLEQRDSSENGSLTPSSDKPGRVPSGYNLYLPSGEVNETLSEKEQKRQRDAAKSLHVRDIIGKLDVISSSATNSFNEQQRMEVLKHAQLHGSNSAEMKYGVNEATINFWRKKVPVQAPNEQEYVTQNTPVPLEHTFVMQGARVSIPNKNIIVTKGVKVPVAKEHMYVTQAPKVPPLKHTFVTQGANVPVQNEHTFVMQGGGGVALHGQHTFATQGAKVPVATEEVFITQATSHRAPTNNSSMPVNWPGGGHRLQPVSVDAPPGIAGGGAEAKVLAWAMELRKNGEDVTFDGLCDQALYFVSQENPGSAYSSTRKWVDRFLNLKVRDLLDVKL